MGYPSRLVLRTTSDWKITDAFATSGTCVTVAHFIQTPSTFLACSVTVRDGTREDVFEIAFLGHTIGTAPLGQFLMGVRFGHLICQTQSDTIEVAPRLTQAIPGIDHTSTELLYRS